MRKKKTFNINLLGRQDKKFYLQSYFLILQYNDQKKNDN